MGKFGPGHVRGLPPGAEALQAETSMGSKNARRRRSKKKGGDAADADAGDTDEAQQPTSTTGQLSGEAVLAQHLLAARSWRLLREQAIILSMHRAVLSWQAVGAEAS